MLSVAGGILKIILFLILGILAFLTALIFVVLLVPLRYRAEGQGCWGEKEKNYHVKVRISWLWHVVSFYTEINGDGYGFRLGVLGIPIIRGGIWEKKRNTKRRKKQTAVSVDPEYENVSDPGYTEPEPKVPFPEPEKKNDAEIPRRKKAERITCTKKKICDKIKKIKENLFLLRDFAEDPDNRQAFRFICSEAKKAFRHIFPTKIFGKISFSMEDPSSTGKVLMILGILYPFLGDGIQVVPLFENRNCGEGSLAFKGRIRAGSLLIIIIRIWFNGQFQKFIKKGRKLRKEMSQSL